MAFKKIKFIRIAQYSNDTKLGWAIERVSKDIQKAKQNIDRMFAEGAARAANPQEINYNVTQYAQKSQQDAENLAQLLAKKYANSTSKVQLENLLTTYVQPRMQQYVQSYPRIMQQVQMNQMNPMMAQQMAPVQQSSQNQVDPNLLQQMMDKMNHDPAMVVSALSRMYPNLKPQQLNQIQIDLINFGKGISNNNSDQALSKWMDRIKFKRTPKSRSEILSDSSTEWRNNQAELARAQMQQMMSGQMPQYPIWGQQYLTPAPTQTPPWMFQMYRQMGVQTPQPNMPPQMAQMLAAQGRR